MFRERKYIHMNINIQKIRKIAFVAFVTLSLIGCESNNTPSPQTTKLSELNGSAQKGPFVAGSSVSLFEIDLNNNKTGKVFNTQILNNKGEYIFNNLELASNLITLKADGFYFNEITGKNSNAQISLNSIAKLNNISSLNINLLTHLEKPRVEKLLLDGLTFEKAKRQAEKEIFKIFELTIDTTIYFEDLNLAKIGENNEKLLAISSILQGYRSESELTELLSDISLDIADNGILDNTVLGGNLISHSKFLNTEKIKNNIVSKYGELGININPSSFESYINIFNDNSKFTSSLDIVNYPIDGSFGKNLLHNSLVEAKFDVEYSLNVNLPRDKKYKLVISADKPLTNITYGNTNPLLSFIVEMFPSDYENHKSRYLYTNENVSNADISIIFRKYSPYNYLPSDSTNNINHVAKSYKFEFFLDDNSVPYQSKIITFD